MPVFVFSGSYVVGHILVLAASFRWKITEHVYRYTWTSTRQKQRWSLQRLLCLDKQQGLLTQKNHQEYFLFFSPFRFAPVASTGPACGCRTRARYVDDPETSGDDFATKRGEKQQREEAETSTQVYKAVSSVSLSRLSGNENVRPARILIPRTEPPPGWCGPRATPFFFASPMSPRAVLLFLTALPTPAALTLPGIIFNNYFH